MEIMYLLILANCRWYWLSSIFSTVCQWEDDRIIVNGTVRIEPPYGEANIKGNEKEVAEVKEWVLFCVIYFYFIVNEDEILNF